MVFSRSSNPVPNGVLEQGPSVIKWASDRNAPSHTVFSRHKSTVPEGELRL
jgi:hypothetical protein